MTPRNLMLWSYLVWCDLNHVEGTYGTTPNTSHPGYYGRLYSPNRPSKVLIQGSPDTCNLGVWEEIRVLKS